MSRLAEKPSERSLVLPSPPVASKFATDRATRYFRGLDGIRFLSALAVLWEHTGFVPGQAPNALAARGLLGVDVLSRFAQQRR